MTSTFSSFKTSVTIINQTECWKELLIDIQYQVNVAYLNLHIRYIYMRDVSKIGRKTSLERESRFDTETIHNSSCIQNKS